MKTKILTIGLLGITSLSGCFSVSVPEFDLPAIDNPVQVAETKPSACPKTEKPVCSVVAKLNKLPLNIKLEKVNGKVVSADAGGLEMLNNYLDAYEAVEKQWRALPQ
jgi:hypothetical protein